MEKYRVVYHPKVIKADLPKTGQIARKILFTINKKLSTRPQVYGLPLRSPLKKYWKLRLGDWRVVYEIVSLEVRVIVIAHRRHIYDLAIKRLGLD